MVWKMIFLFQGARILRFQPLIFWGVEHDFGIFQSSPLARSVGRWVRRSPSFVSAASQLVVFGRSPFGSGRAGWRPAKGNEYTLRSEGPTGVLGAGGSWQMNTLSETNRNSPENGEKPNKERM